MLASLARSDQFDLSVNSLAQDSAEAFWRHHELTPGRRADDVLRELEELRDRISLGERERASIALRLATLETKPLEAGNVLWSGKALLGAVALAASIVGSSYWLNGDARQNGRDIKFMIEERTKAQDKINIETKAAIEDVKRDIRATEERIKAEIRMKEYAKANGLKQP